MDVLSDVNDGAHYCDNDDDNDNNNTNNHDKWYDDDCGSIEGNDDDGGKSGWGSKLKKKYIKNIIFIKIMVSFRLSNTPSEYSHS